MMAAFWGIAMFGARGSFAHRDIQLRLSSMAREGVNPLRRSLVNEERPVTLSGATPSHGETGA
jgi:hypothetical protein